MRGLILSAATGLLLLCLPAVANAQTNDELLSNCKDRRLPFERAVEFCQQVIVGDSSRPYVAAAMAMRGDRHEEEGRPELAAADYAGALELYYEEAADNDSAEVRTGAAAVHFRLYDFEASLAAYNTAIRMDREFASAYLGRGITRFRIGDYQGAVSDFDFVASLRSRAGLRGASRTGGARVSVSPRIEGYRCEARAAARIELDIARQACRRALSASPDTIFSRGFLHFLEGDIEAAHGDFNAAVEADERDGVARYARGVTATLLGREAEGRADIEAGTALARRGSIDYYANAGLRLPD